MIGDRSRLPLGGLLGRERERAALDRLLASARQGLSGSLVVRGEAGVGKTALLGYAAESASGMRVLRVTGVQAEYDLAFAGLHALLWPFADELRQVPEPQRSALAAALGMARGESRDRFLVSAGVLSLLAAAAESGPILCLPIVQGAERARLLGLSGVICGLAGSLQDGIATLLEAIALSEDPR